MLHVVYVIKTYYGAELRIAETCKLIMLLL
jgi:hypothetical protein